MDREAIEEAIEVLEDASAEMLTETGDKNYYIEAIAVLRQALVDADDTSQERVDEIVKDEHEPVTCVCGAVWEGEQMVHAPRPREWVGLTDEEIAQGLKESWVTEQAWQSAVWWAEAKLKEKNHG
jgi:hypothetical protein